VLLLQYVINYLTLSEIKEPFLIVDPMIELVEISDQVLLLERVFRLREVSVLILELLIKAVPLLVVVLPVLLVLFDGVNLALIRIHPQGLLEGERIDLFQDGLQRDQTLLQDLVPVLVGQLGDHWHQHREGLVLVGLENVEEVVVLEEAHGSVRHLQVYPADALDDPLEKAGDQVLDFVDLADFEDLLELCEE